MSKVVLRFFLKGSSVLLGLALMYHLTRGSLTSYRPVRLVSSRPRDDVIDDVTPDHHSADATDWTEARFSEISPLYDVRNVDCKSVLENNSLALQHALNVSRLKENQGFRITDEQYSEQAKHCESFVKKRGYIMSSLSKVEEDFPLAYSIIAHKGAEALERLLRAIYRPQNIYCIHIDAKSKQDFYNAAAAISGCFPNVFMAPRRIDVRWGEFSVLEPELLCMEELYKRKASWKYFINLTGEYLLVNTGQYCV